MGKRNFRLGLVCFCSGPFKFLKKLGWKLRQSSQFVPSGLNIMNKFLNRK